MKLRRVLVVYKKSVFQVYATEPKDPQFLKLLKSLNIVAKRFVRSHEAHSSALERVERILERAGLEAEFVYRAQSFEEAKFDLILSVGGDGTFLEASHGVKRKPLLGLNSSPADSVGFFCGATVETLEDHLETIAKGKHKITEMTRLQIKVGAEVLPVPVLNDVLISHGNPAATTRYILRFRGREEEHKSSGIWITPASGSTAGIGGAGGKFMSIRSRSGQFVVRELYRQPGQRFKFQRGLIRPTETLNVISKMRSGQVFLDGPHLQYPFPIGELAEISTAAPRLRAVAFDERRRRRYWA